MKGLFLSVLVIVFSCLGSKVSAQTVEVVSRPMVVSIYNIERMEANTLHILALDQNHARIRRGGQGSPLVIFTDHGVPMNGIYAPLGKPSGFIEVYYDRDGDGQVDGSVFALDLSTQTDVWITWLAGDKPGIVYLHPSVQIKVGGVHRVVYRPTNKQDSDVVSCNMGLVSKPGGHRQIGAYQMTPRWN